MKKLLLIALSISVFSMGIFANKKPVDYVNPFVESKKSRYFFFNSACRPFGMVNLNPDTVLRGCWQSGYRYQEPFIRGLSHIHYWGIGGLSIMPTAGEVDFTKGVEEWKSPFSHEREKAGAGYHQVYLDKYGINVELTSTDRVGYHRYSFDADKSVNLVLNLSGEQGDSFMEDSYIKRASPRELHGWVRMRHFNINGMRTKLFFAIRSDKPIIDIRHWQLETPEIKPLEGGEVAGDNMCAILGFGKLKNKKLNLQVAVSWTSMENAKLNLDTETKGKDFDAALAESRKVWNDELSKIEVSGGSEEQYTKFYTDLWHTLLGRRQIQDIDGSYPDYLSKNGGLWKEGELSIFKIPLDKDGKPKFRHHNSDSWWLSRCSINVLWGLAYPKVLSDVVNSQLLYYEHGGHLPRGPIVGRYSAIMTSCGMTDIIVSSYNKGIRDFDIDKAYEAMYKAQTQKGSTCDWSNGKIEEYMQKGYVSEDKPMHVWGGAGRVMEYVQIDWALAQFAKQLGKNDDYMYFLKRSDNWRNMYDSSVGFIRPKNKDGSWLEDFDPLKNANHGGFIEANSWQTTWMATHDVKGLAELMGGFDNYTKKLNEAFEKSEKSDFIGGHGNTIINYANEPGIYMAHLFVYAGKPWLTQYWARQIYNKVYSEATPDKGYGGHDEDQGKSGSVSALLSMGLYQLLGGVDKDAIYEITAPIFETVTIYLDPRYYKGKTFKIIAKNQAPENFYIQSAKLNGKKLDRAWISHSEFANGGVLELELGNKPNKSWGVNDIPNPETYADTLKKN